MFHLQSSQIPIIYSCQINNVLPSINISDLLFSRKNDSQAQIERGWKRKDGWMIFLSSIIPATLSLRHYWQALSLFWDTNTFEFQVDPYQVAPNNLQRRQRRKSFCNADFGGWKPNILGDLSLMDGPLCSLYTIILCRPLNQPLWTRWYKFRIHLSQIFVQRTRRCSETPGLGKEHHNTCCLFVFSMHYEAHTSSL